MPTAICRGRWGDPRQVADLNLPGQPKAIAETLEGLKDADGAQKVPGIFAAVPYCIDLDRRALRRRPTRRGEGLPAQVGDPSRPEAASNPAAGVAARARPLTEKILMTLRLEPGVWGR